MSRNLFSHKTPKAVRFWHHKLDKLTLEAKRHTAVVTGSGLKELCGPHETHMLYYRITKSVCGSHPRFLVIKIGKMLIWGQCSLIGGLCHSTLLVMSVSKNHLPAPTMHQQHSLKPCPIFSQSQALGSYTMWKTKWEELMDEFLVNFIDTIYICIQELEYIQ